MVQLLFPYYFSKIQFIDAYPAPTIGKELFKNDAIIQKDGNTIDFKPVVKIFTPDANCEWLLTELSPDGIGFGLCDLGHGSPEMGSLDMEELQAFRGQLGLPVERGKGFVADKTLSQYAELARREGKILS